MNEYRDEDGTLLLFVDEVARRAGVDWATINSYHAQSKRQRARYHRTPPGCLPAPVRKVRRRLVKSDGAPVVVHAQLWREDDINEWLAWRAGRRRTKKGVPR